MQFSPIIKLGVELEVEIKDDPNKATPYKSKHNIYGSYPKHHLLGKIHKNHGVMVSIVDEICEDKITTHYDNTVNDGFEWIGEPMSLRENKRLWGQLLIHEGIAPYIHGEDVKITNHTYGIHDVGMHVHVSGDPITRLLLGKIFLFINATANKPFIECIAGRKLNKFCTTKPTQKIIDFNKLYHSVDCRKTTKQGEKIKRNLDGGYDCFLPSGLTCCGNANKLISADFQRGAVWVSPAMATGDYEIRIFKSAVNPERFYANLEFCVALVDFCHGAKINELKFTEFGKWMSSLSNRLKYGYLFKFMRTQGYTKGIIPKNDTLKTMIAKGKLSEPIRAIRNVE